MPARLLWLGLPAGYTPRLGLLHPEIVDPPNRHYARPSFELLLSEIFRGRPAWTARGTGLKTTGTWRALTITEAAPVATTLDIAPQPRLLRSCPFVELEQSVASRVADISPFVDHLMQFIKALLHESRNEDGSEVDIEIALREALANAIIHGNEENPQKRVHVNCRCTMEGEVTITIRDEGRGFDPRALADPTDPDHLLLTHGRGVCLMHALMDTVNFEERGTVVRMRKRLRATVEAFFTRFVLAAVPPIGTGGACGANSAGPC